ncbi:MAG: PaaI family thioesterase [Deltaproteobacteria bacterium]|nr:MAG: PaaI family thioesterase [Deltaproteobacteria bacterium]
MFDAIRLARDTGNVDGLVRLIPYLQFMGISMHLRDGELVGRLAFSDHLIGNARIQALHGGTLGALLESTAVFKLLVEAETVKLPKTINITVEYLRSGKPLDTFARAEFIRHGRRVANVRAWAWQDDPDRPIAAANAHFLLVPEGD